MSSVVILMVAFAAAVLCLVPGVAEACSVCFSAREENRVAFIATTGFMTAMPFVLVGSLGWWLRARVLEHEQSERESAENDRKTTEPR
jgi:ABC-type nickel/cobalt efflux system permease component RcnA